MNRIQRCLAVLAGLGGALDDSAAMAPAAFAMIVHHPATLAALLCRLCTS